MVLQYLGQVFDRDLETERIVESVDRGCDTRSCEMMCAADGPRGFDPHPMPGDLSRASDVDSTGGEKDDPIDQRASPTDRLTSEVEALLGIGCQHREDVRRKSVQIGLRLEKKCAIQRRDEG